MKKTLTYTLFVLLCTCSLFAKEKTYLSARILYPYSDNTTNEYEDSIIKVRFDVSSSCLIVHLFNKTNNRINLEWENFRIDESAIAFDTDRRIKMDEPKADEVIFPLSYSTHTKLIPKKAIEDSYIGDWWNIDIISKIGEKFSKVIIPIKVNNVNFDYLFHLGIACVTNGVRSKINTPTKEQIDSLYIGMKYKDAIAIIGYPQFFTQNEKSFVAHYYNGLNFEVQTNGKIVAEALSNFASPTSLSLGWSTRNKTIITKIDTTHIHDSSPEDFFRNLYK